MTTPPSSSDPSFLAEIIGLLRQLAPSGGAITPQTRILADLDLDSLKMLELIDALKERHGVDFLAEPDGLAALKTPETLAAALVAAKANVGR
jgi:acyl carrier protein